MVALPPTRETLLQIAQQLPASPQVLLNLSDLLTDVNSGLDDVAILLRRDSALAARVIRISNSVAYGMGGGVASIEEAVNRVGYAEIYRLVGLATAVQMSDQTLHSYGISGTQLRDNTLVTALATEALAVRAGMEPRAVYTAGLLRSTGKIILDRFSKQLPRLQSFSYAGSTDVLTWEQATFGMTNVQAAEVVLSAWRFPAAIVGPVRHQFSPTEIQGDRGNVAALLHLACISARDAGFGLLGEQAIWRSAAPLMEPLSLTPSLVAEAAEEAMSSFEAIRSSL